MNRYGSIYIIKNKVNNKTYIGQTIQNSQSRWIAHISKSKSKLATCIQKELKNKLHNFEFEEIMTCFDKNSLNYYEQYFIEKYNSLYPNGYNKKTGGNTVTFTSDVKRKMSLKKLGKESHNHIVGIIAFNIITKTKTTFKSFKSACRKLKISRSSILKSCKYGIVRKNYLFSYANQSGSNKNKSLLHAQRLESEPVKSEYNLSTSVRFPKKYMNLQNQILLLSKTLSSYKISKMLNLDKSMVTYFIHCFGK